MTVALQRYAFNQLSIFSGVDDTDLKRWLSYCSCVSFTEGDVVLQPQVSNEKMYIILSGQVTIHIGAADNASIACVGVGECVGEMSLFDSQNPSAFVIAQSALECLCIDRQTLLAMVDESHAIAKNLLYLVSRRLRSGNLLMKSSQQLQKEYEQHANVDALTGLYNRRWVNNYFNRLITAPNHGEDVTLSLMMVDVDRFKQFNDQHGHNAGDIALQCLADALSIYIRPTDVAIRYGGEEFIILLPATSLVEAEKVADRLRAGIQSTEMSSLEKTYPSITASIGVAQWQAGDEQVDLIGAADSALYKAKNLGRNRVCINYRA